MSYFSRCITNKFKVYCVGALAFLATFLVVIQRSPRTPPILHPTKRGVSASNELFEIKLQLDTLTRFETINLYVTLKNNIELLEITGIFSLYRVDTGRLIATKSKVFNVSREATLIDIFNSDLIHLGLYEGGYELRVTLTIPVSEPRSDFILPFKYEELTEH